MRTGIATVPLDYGRCPPWLFERMKRLARGIIIAIAEEFRAEEILKRFSDPVWFQSFGCVLGFDWNSSGLTTTTMGAVKVALFDIQDELGIYICGGKGKTSRKTPEEILAYGISRAFPFAEKLIYSSKMSAKIDSSLIQDGFQIYHHNFLFTKSGNWAVVQQGMDKDNQKARRYHWLSSTLRQAQGKPDFVEEPHSGIVSDIKGNPLNLTAKKSDDNRQVSIGLVKEEPKTFLKNIKKITDRSVLKKPWQGYYTGGNLLGQMKLKNFTEMELNDVEFYHHPVVEEKFDIKRLEKTIFFASEQKPENFEKLLSLKGVGPKTIRALSLVSEIIYGAKPSYEDPARYTFSVGGKDGTPFPVDRTTYDKTLELMEKGIEKAKISEQEKLEAQTRLKESSVAAR